MRKINHRFCAIAILALFSVLAPAAMAFITPVAVSIVPPVQFPSEEFSVTGARLNLIYGRHRDLYGLDVGLIGNITNQDFVGIGIAGGFNATHGTTHIIGLQAAGIGNFNYMKTTVVGIQLAGLINSNITETHVYGLQLALLNMSEFTDIYGVQAGVYNRAKTVYGFQIGLVNVATSLYGVQIGLVNFNGGGPFKVSPLINIGF